MITQSRDALRTALRTVFPVSEVKHIHLANLTVGFTRPALYMEMNPLNHQRLSAQLHGYLVRWQVIYFPSEDAAGNASYSDLHGAAEKLEALLARADTLTSPDGTLMAVEDPELYISDDLVYCKVALRTGLLRGEPAAQKAGEVTIDIAMSDGKDA